MPEPEVAFYAYSLFPLLFLLFRNLCSHQAAGATAVWRQRALLSTGAGAADGAGRSVQGKGRLPRVSSRPAVAAASLQRGPLLRSQRCTLTGCESIPMEILGRKMSHNVIF